MTKVQRLESRIDELWKEVEELRHERRVFREHFQTRFKWWIKLMGENGKPNLTWLVEDDARWLQRVKEWTW